MLALYFKDVEAVLDDKMLDFGIVAQGEHGPFTVLAKHHFKYRMASMQAMEHSPL
jgi:hypothetical protein